MSKASRRVGPLYHDRLSDLSIMLSPWNPEMGTKATCNTASGISTTGSGTKQNATRLPTSIF